MKILVLILAFAMGVTTLLRYLTLAQNNDYRLVNNSAFRREFFLKSALAAVACCPIWWLTSIVYGVGTIVSAVLYCRRRKKFGCTRRATLYLILSFILSAAAFIGAYFLPTEREWTFIPIAAMQIMLVFCVKITEWALNPHFRKKNERFIKTVSKTFSGRGTKLIAITGSFGKTGCKNILYTLLSGRYSVAMTEGNFNTPMGVALSMNKSERTDFFIAEFGARKAGDIEELCRYFPPDIGLITGVCLQHSGVFGSIHTIYNEKFKLAKNVKEGGFCAFGNNLYGQKMYREYAGDKVTCGVKGEIFADEICFLPGKTQFNLHIYDKRATVCTKLCGGQAIENITLCVAVAYKLGIAAEEIFERIPFIEQVPHRLQYIFSGGVHILDDSYNSNSEGVRYALDYLNIYPVPRIVLAQGVVEMGINQKKANILIGEEAADVADTMILIGKNRKDIAQGLKNKKFKGKVVFCRTLRQGVSEMQKRLLPGATVLFQNDVPEIY